MALVPDLLLLMSSLQPQTVAEEQADSLTAFHAPRGVKPPKRNDDLCSTFLRYRCMFLAEGKTLTWKYSPTALNGGRGDLEGDDIIFWVAIEWFLASFCWIIHLPLIFSCFCKKYSLRLVAEQLASEFPTSARILPNLASNYKFPKALKTLPLCQQQLFH